MPRDVTVIGPLNIDLLIKGDGPSDWAALLPDWDGPAQMDMTAAGAVGYTVQNLAWFGLSVAVSSCLPDDPLGLFIQDALRRAGVDTDSIQQIVGTVGGIGVYALLFGSRKRPLIYRLPTHPLWPTEFAPDDVDRLLDARLLHQGGYLHFSEAWHGALCELFRAAKARGLITSLDPQFPLFSMPRPWMSALADLLPFVDILFCDLEEALNLTFVQNQSSAASLLRSAGAQVVVIKEGDRGSTVYHEGGQFHQNVLTFGQVEDTVGAGDAYNAGFLYGTLQGWSLEDRALFASIAAGFSVTGVGGAQSMPELSVLLTEMNHQR